MALVFRFFPEKEEEEAVRASYHAADGEAGDGVSAEPVPTHVGVPGGPAPHRGRLPKRQTSISPSAS